MQHAMCLQGCSIRQNHNSKADFYALLCSKSPLQYSKSLIRPFLNEKLSSSFAVTALTSLLFSSQIQQLLNTKWNEMSTHVALVFQHMHADPGQLYFILSLVQVCFELFQQCYLVTFSDVYSCKNARQQPSCCMFSLAPEQKHISCGQVDTFYSKMCQSVF